MELMVVCALALDRDGRDAGSDFRRFERTSNWITTWGIAALKAELRSGEASDGRNE
jgi:hypothetical protein